MWQSTMGSKTRLDMCNRFPPCARIVGRALGTAVLALVPQTRMSAQPVRTGASDTTVASKATQQRRHALELGIRMSLPAGPAAALGYVAHDSRGARMRWVEVEGATVKIVSSLSMAAGVFIGSDRDWLLGARLGSTRAWGFFQREPARFTSVGIEAGRAVLLDASERFLIDARVGIGVWRNQRQPHELVVLPDLRIGTAVLLGR